MIAFEELSIKKVKSSWNLIFLGSDLIVLQFPNQSNYVVGKNKNNQFINCSRLDKQNTSTNLNIDNKPYVVWAAITK